MAVITKFFIVRNGIELDRVFEDRKEAEAYDKMLDAAEKLAALIRESDLPVAIDAETIDAVSICLAKNGPDVTQILKGIKAIPAQTPSAAKESAPPQESPPIKGKKPAAQKAGAGPQKK